MTKEITQDQAQAASVLAGRIAQASGYDIEAERAHVDGDGGWFLVCYDKRRHAFLTVTSFEDFIAQRPECAQQTALPLSY